MKQVPLLGERFEEALIFAFHQHNNQVRKATEVPYISHLMSVAGIVLEYGGGEDEAIAALLHDAVEDNGGLKTLAEIVNRFGEQVAEIVWGCSDSHTQPKPTWKPRKVAYLQRLPQEPDSVRLVSAADKLHNARTILADYRKCGEDLWQRFNGGREGTLWYYRSLVEIFQKTSPKHLAEELDRVVTELETLAGK